MTPLPPDEETIPSVKLRESTSQMPLLWSMMTQSSSERLRKRRLIGKWSGWYLVLRAGGVLGKGAFFRVGWRSPRIRRRVFPNPFTEDRYGRLGLIKGVGKHPSPY